MLNLNRLGHVVFRVADLQQSKKFYTEVLGLRVLEEDPKVQAVFLGLGGHGNTVDLVQSVDPSASAPFKDFTTRAGLGFHHAAFAVDSHETLKSGYLELKERGVPIIAMTDHGSTESVYFNDPDGNVLEIYWDRPDGWQKRIAGQEDHDEKLVFD
jgi:catechol 2,3-dioxygenase